MHCFNHATTSSDRRQVVFEEIALGSELRPSFYALATLSTLIAALRQRGFRLVGLTVREGANMPNASICQLLRPTSAVAPTTAKSLGDFTNG